MVEGGSLGLLTRHHQKKRRKKKKKQEPNPSIGVDRCKRERKQNLHLQQNSTTRFWSGPLAIGGDEFEKKEVSKREQRKEQRKRLEKGQPRRKGNERATAQAKQTRKKATVHRKPRPNRNDTSKTSSRSKKAFFPSSSSSSSCLYVCTFTRECQCFLLCARYVLLVVVPALKPPRPCLVRLFFFSSFLWCVVPSSLSKPVSCEKKKGTLIHTYPREAKATTQSRRKVVLKRLKSAEKCCAEQGKEPPYVARVFVSVCGRCVCVYRYRVLKCRVM